MSPRHAPYSVRLARPEASSQAGTQPKKLSTRFKAVKPPMKRTKAPLNSRNARQNLVGSKLKKPRAHFAVTHSATRLKTRNCQTPKLKN